MGMGGHGASRQGPCGGIPDFRGFEDGSWGVDRRRAMAEPGQSPSHDRAISNLGHDRQTAHWGRFEFAR